MALEVNEIGIRLQVRDREDDDDKTRRKDRDEPGGCECEGGDRDGIVEECVRRVLRILKETRER